VVSEQHSEEQEPKAVMPTGRNLSRLKLAGAILTSGGLALFAYFIYTVGFDDLLSGISRFGFVGFAIILVLYFLRMTVRAMAWRMSVYEAYSLTFRDTLGPHCRDLGTAVQRCAGS
jgi:hypothetical protein